MPKGSLTLPESSSRTRLSPYPMRSSRTNKYMIALESFIESEWEDKRCVICMEPPHNAVLLTCGSNLSGCRPYMCGTGKRHSNCFKQFCKANKKKRFNTKILHCPLCRDDVFETTKVAKPARRFMNSKPRSCTVDGCEFSGTYCQLDKHFKTEHCGSIPPKVDPQRQAWWDQMERYDENVQFLTAAGIQGVAEIVHHPLSITHQAFQVMTVDGTVHNLIVPRHVRNESGPANGTAAPLPERGIYPANFTAAPMYGNPPTTPQPGGFDR